MACYRTIVGSRRLNAAVVVLLSCVISACGAGAGAAKDAVNSSTSKYTVGGGVSGLSGSGLVLQDNNADSLAVSGNGSFTFSTALAAAASYAVTVATQPANPAQTCTVTHGTGTIGAADVTSVAVNCTTQTFTVGGSVTGLTGSGLILEDNGASNLAVSANGTFTFATPVASGAAYAVSVKAQPTNPAQTCSVANGSGTLGAANVTSVAVSCSATGGAITMQQRRAVFAAVEAQYTALSMQSGNFSTLMAEYLRTLPVFTEVGIASDNSIYAEFTDGTELIVSTDQGFAGHPSAAETSTARAATTRAAAERAVVKESAVTQPGVNQALITQEFGSGYKTTEALTTDIANWLQAAGYTATAVQGAGTDYLRGSVKDADVFMMTGHSGTGKTGVYAFWTATAYSNATQADENDVKAGRMRYMTAQVDKAPYSSGTPACENPNGCPIADTHYAITASFIPEYMTFSPGSFVMMNGCDSAAASATGFMSAFSSAGAANYLGWAGTSGDDGADPIRYVFDRLLGEVPGGGNRTIAQESPPQRAFDIGPVLQTMTDQGIIPLHVVDSSGRVVEDGTLTAEGSGNAILAPSIAFVSTTDYSKLLGIAGIFDPTQKANAAVTVGGQACPIVDWSAETVTCTLPESGPGSEGDVVVSVNGIQSNAVSLTSWRGTFKFQITGESDLQSTLLLDLHWRADIHNWRTAPHVQPHHYDLLEDLAQDSTANWTASGSETYTPPSGPPETLSISGGGSIPQFVLGSSSSATENYTGSEVIDPDTQIQWIYLDALAEGQIAVSGNMCVGPASFAMTILEFSPQSVSYYTMPPPYGTQQVSTPALPLPMDATYALLAGEQSANFGTGCPYGFRGGGSTWKLSWPGIASTSPPDPTAAQ